MAARAIRAGDADLVIAGGVESMSRAPFVLPKARSAFSRSAEIHDTTIGWRFVNPEMREQFGTERCRRPRRTSPADYGVSREDQDAFACARRSGRQGDRRRTGWPGRSPGNRSAARARRRRRRDEHPRETSLEALASCRPFTRAAPSPPATRPASTTARPHCDRFARRVGSG